MGVNVDLVFEYGTRADDVAAAAGVLAGLPVRSDGRGFSRVSGVMVRPTSIPQSPELLLRGLMVDGERVHHTMFHYEGNGGRPSIAPPSTAFWVAVCRRLVDFFGGRLVYDDCSSQPGTYQRPSPRKVNDPQDGPAWKRFDRELHALAPLTERDLAAAAKYAYYGTER